MEQSYDLAFTEGCHESVSLRFFNLYQGIPQLRLCPASYELKLHLLSYELRSLSWHRKAQGCLCKL